MTSFGMFGRFFIVGLIAGVGWSARSARGAGTVIFSTSTDKQQYVVGETLNVLVKAENPGDQPVSFVFSSGYQADYLMDGVDLWSSHRGFIQAFTGKTVPAHGSYTWTLPHLWNYYAPSVGTHSVMGKVVGYDYTAAAQFSVIALPSLSEPVAPLPEPAGTVGVIALMLASGRRSRLKARTAWRCG